MSVLSTPLAALASIEKSLGINGPATASTASQPLDLSAGTASSGGIGGTGVSVSGTPASNSTGVSTSSSPLTAIGSAAQNLGTAVSNFLGIGSGVASITNQLLRLVLLILGLICIAGAIYLYKGPGSSIVAVPGNWAKKQVGAAKDALLAS